MARFSKYVLLANVQRRRFEWVTERLGSQKNVCVIPASFCAYTLVNGFHYARGDEEYSQYEIGLLASARLPNI